MPANLMTLVPTLRSVWQKKTDFQKLSSNINIHTLTYMCCPSLTCVLLPDMCSPSPDRYNKQNIIKKIFALT